MMVHKVGEIQLPKCYFNFQVFWLRVMGIEIWGRNESCRYKLYSFIILLFNTVAILLEIAELAFHKDFDSLLMVFNTAITHFLGWIRVLVVYKNRKEIGNLLKSLHEGVYKPNVDRGGLFEKHCIKKSIRTTTALMASYGIPICLVYILGLLIGFKMWLTEPKETWKLPFISISIMINTTRSPDFEIAYIYQALTVFLITMSVYSADVTVIAIICQITGQLKILAHSISILETVDAVENLSCYLILSTFVTNIILLCLLMYATSTFGLFSLGFLMYMFFSTIIIAQVFMFCWSGNEMTLAYQRLAIAAAETYSPDEPILQAKALKLMIIRAQKPLCLTVGKFVPLSIETFMAIVKGSFSYFMVLRQVNGE